MASVIWRENWLWGHVTAAQGQQSGAVGRQIKYWILGTVKTLLDSKRNNSNGPSLVTDLQMTRVIEDTKQSEEYDLN